MKAPIIPNNEPPIRITRSVVIGWIFIDLLVSQGFTIFASIPWSIVIIIRILINSLKDLVAAYIKTGIILIKGPIKGIRFPTPIIIENNCI